MLRSICDQSLAWRVSARQANNKYTVAAVRFVTETDLISGPDQAINQTGIIEPAGMAVLSGLARVRASVPRPVLVLIQSCQIEVSQSPTRYHQSIANSGAEEAA